MTRIELEFNRQHRALGVDPSSSRLEVRRNADEGIAPAICHAVGCARVRSVWRGGTS